MIEKMKKYQFLFEELVKRDFKKKYKRTMLGVLWSMLSPLLTLLAMSLIFTNFFGRTTPHFTIYSVSYTHLYAGAGAIPQGAGAETDYVGVWILFCVQRSRSNGGQSDGCLLYTSRCV